MKKSTIYVLTIIAGLLITATTNAQQVVELKSVITPEQFVEKVSGMSIPGFSGRPEFEIDIDDELQAVFMQGSDILLITIETRNNPPSWSVSPYKLDGKDAEYVATSSMGGMGVLVIDLPETYSVLTIGSNKIKDKATLEQIARKTGLMQTTPVSEVGWPARVPKEYRLEGVLLEVSEGPDITTGVFSYQVRATFSMNSQLIESLLGLREKCVLNGAEEVFYQFPGGIHLDFPISITNKGIEEAHRLYKETQKISFTYYFP